MQHFLGNVKMGNGLNLIGPDAHIWGSLLRKDSHSRELIVLKSREAEDWFTRKMCEWTIEVLSLFARVNPRLGVVCVEDYHVWLGTLWFTSLVAAVVPVGAAAVMMKVEGVGARLGVVAGFNVLVVVCLLVLTEARRIEVFLVVAV